MIRSLIRAFPFLFPLLIASACTSVYTPSPPNTSTSLPQSSPSLSPIFTLSPLPSSSAALIQNASTTQPPTPIPLPNTTHYIFHATLDYPAKHLTVAQTIQYYNDTGQTLDELLLVIEPNWTEGVFHLDQMTWEDGTAIENWNLNANILRFPLRKSLSPQGKLTLSLSYRLFLPPQAGMLGFDLRGINLGNWYPFVPPYQTGTGWLAYQRGWVGEHFSHALAGYRVELVLINPPAEVVVAASAPVEQDGDIYRFYHPLARSFALAISPDFHVFRTNVGDVEIISYAYPETLAAGERALQVTADALALYSELFGPYPHPTMSVVQVSFPDGLEFDGLYFLSEEYYWGYPVNPDRLVAAQNYLTIIAAHETSHQWWYALTGNDQAIEPWLDETLATYTELLYYEHYYPELVEWWWAFRVDSYKPRDCCVNFTIYQYGDVRAYINAIYLRGAYFMQDLRDTLQDEAFFAALNAYAKRFRDGFATAQDFWNVIGEYTNEDLTSLQLRYFGGS